MSFNIQKIQEAASSATGNSPLSALYPPNKLEGDKVTITGFLEGVGIESFTFEPAGYAKLTVYKEIPDTDNKRSYGTIVADFFTSEARIDLNGRFLLEAFLAVEPDADMTKFPKDLNSLEEVVNAFNSTFNLPSQMNPDAVAKVVFREVLGEKSKYNLSKNFPSVGLKGSKSIKFKTGGKDPKWDDVTVFTKVAPSTDDALGGSNTGFSAPNTNFDTSNL